MVLGAEVYSKMPRNWSKAVPEGNGPIPHQDEFGPDQPTSADVYRRFEEMFDRQLNQMKSYFDEFTEKMRETRQRSASLEQDAQQSRLVMEADVTSDKKTRKRTESAAAAERVISGDNSPAQVDTDAIRSTSFGMKSEPLALSRRDDVLVDRGVAAPRSCLSPVEMRTLTAAGGLLPVGIASTAMRIIFPRPFFF